MTKFPEDISNDPDGTDWRSKPRKPAHKKKLANIGFRCTEAQAQHIRDKATEAGQTLGEYLLALVFGG